MAADAAAPHAVGVCVEFEVFGKVQVSCTACQTLREQHEVHTLATESVFSEVYQDKG